MTEDRAYAAREVHRKVYRDMYKDYSDEQLELKREAAYQKCMALTDPRDIQGVGQMLLAEMEVCNEITGGRLNVKKRLLEKKSEWADELRKIRDSAVLNLKAATTPNGQLVLSILEDEGGLRFQDLQGWCDELAELPDEDFTQILLDLIGDGVLEKNEEDQKYYLKTPCTTAMQFEPEFARRYWAYYPLEKTACTVEIQRAIGDAILRILIENGGPMCGYECKKYAEDECYPEASPTFLDGGYMTKLQKEMIWMNMMRKLVEAGILMHAYSTREIRAVEGSGYFQDYRLHSIDWFCDFAVIGYQEPEEDEKEDDEE